VEIENIITQYLNTPLNIQGVFCSITPQLQASTKEISSNAVAQKKAAEYKQLAEKELIELKSSYNFSTNIQLYRELLLEKQNEVVRYDQPGRPSLLMQYPNLLDNIHNLIEYGAANVRRRKEAIKVRTVNHLHQNLKENYNIYMSRSSLNNYLLPHRSNSIVAKAHHHPAWVAVAGVSRDETKEHPDEYYCLASVKGTKQFAKTFANLSVIISQDDKSKIGLGVPAVGRTFQALQSVAKPIRVSDHDFPYGSNQKLVLSVYLIIQPDKSNDDLHSGQLEIFVQKHCNLYQYVLDIKRCNDLECCNPVRAKEAMDFLIASDGFLPPVVKA
ncbi:35705_t:CDS:2, partial [Gigaspora margarita]